jgi:hypothetical protein
MLKSISLFLFLFFDVFLLPKKFNIKNPPPRIIRTCCSFGNELGVGIIPFYKLTEVSTPAELGKHAYMGGKSEKNGIIYSKKGGFIDTGHLRDIADITAYLYGAILENRDKEFIEIKLGNEGGQKTLKIFPKIDLSHEDYAALAGKIAYDLSVWHEISTWNGASFIPMVPERYSSYSVEDAFSNLLGVHLGMRAILSKNAYETEMDSLLRESLKYYQAVESTQETKDAMDAVEGIWWNKKARYPSKKILKLHLFELYGCISPMLVETKTYGDEKLCVPDKLSNGKSVNDYFELAIETNFKIPVKKAKGTEFNTKRITQRDFQSLIDYAKQREAVGKVK